jgi:hypothetical protein
MFIVPDTLLPHYVLARILSTRSFHMHPRTFFKDFFQKDPPLPIAGRCFVAMPFRERLESVYTAIEAALGVDELRFRCYRAKEEPRGGFIMEQVLQELKDAEVVIADLTTRNPNVFYELGIAHTLKNRERVVLISQTKVPFDVSSYRHLKYTLTDLPLLQQDLVKTIKTITPARRRITKSINDTYESEAAVPGDDDTFHHFSVRVLQIAEEAARLRIAVWPTGEPDKRESEDHTLSLFQRADIRKIHYAVKLDAVRAGEVEFCICDPHRTQPSSPH